MVSNSSMVNGVVLQVLLIALHRGKVWACQNAEACLYADLFEDYKRFARPVLHPSTAITVNISFTIEALSAIHEKNQVMDTVGFIKAIWYDELLRWEPSDYNGSRSLILPAEEIWLADICLYNSADTKYQRTYKRDFLVVIESTGRVTWEFGGIFSTQCSLDISEYPYDTQMCNITPGIWRYTTSELDLHPLEVDTSIMQTNSLWLLEKTEHNYHVGNFSNGAFASTPFVFTWSRKPLYYVMTILLPIVFIMVVALSLFWLPADCGEKVSLGITVLLALGVLQLVITEQTPVNSDVTPKIGKLVVVVMGISTLSLLGAMFSIYFNFHSPSTPIPRVLKVVVFEYIAKLFFLKPDFNDRSRISMTRSTETELTATAGQAGKQVKCNLELTAILDELKVITKTLVYEDEEQRRVAEWKFLAKVIDRLLLWISIIILAVCLINIYS